MDEASQCSNSTTRLQTSSARGLERRDMRTATKAKLSEMKIMYDGSSSLCAFQRSKAGVRPAAKKAAVPCKCTGSKGTGRVSKGSAAFHSYKLHHRSYNCCITGSAETRVERPTRLWKFFCQSLCKASAGSLPHPVPGTIPS